MSALKKFFLFLMLSFLASSQVYGLGPNELKVVEEKGVVSFHATTSPRILKVIGEAQGPKGTLLVGKDGLEGILEFDLRNLKTGIGLRDSHMKEKYLEVGKFPAAKLKILSAGVPVGFYGNLNADERPFQAALMLRGKEHPIKEGFFSIKGGELEARFKILLSEFDINNPSHLGLTVADKVEVSVKFPVAKE